MNEKKTYRVVVTSSYDNHEILKLDFFCFMMAQEYIEEQYKDDCKYGECGEFKYYINGEWYI